MMEPTDQTPKAGPLYARIKQRLIRRVASGEWPPGALLPSETALAAEYGVSQGTLRKALDALAAERLVVRQQGRGTLVARHDNARSLFQFFHIHDHRGERQLPDSKLLVLDRARATALEAAALGLKPRAPVWRIDRVRYLNGAAAMVEAISLSQALFPDLDTLGELPNALYALYQSRYGVTVARASEHLSAIPAGPRDAALLGLARGAPLLAIERWAMDLEGHTVEWRRSRLDTRHHYYRNELD